MSRLCDIVKELAIAYRELRLRTKAHALFEAIDIDDSGLLDEGELQMLLEKLEKEGMMSTTATMTTQSKSGLSSDTCCPRK